MTTVTGPKVSSSPSRESRESQLRRETSILASSEGKALENHAAAGMALRRIRENALWAVKHASYHEFLREEGLEIRRATRYVTLSLKWEELKKTIDPETPMPERISHLLALDQVKAEHRGFVWMTVLNEGKPVTPSLINCTIRTAILASSSVRGPEVLKEESVKGVQEARKRIGELCGEKVLGGIDNNKYRVSQKELIVWARQDDENVHAICRAVTKLGWTITKAIDALFKPLSPGTTMRELAALNIMRNRPVAIAFGGSSIRAEEFH